MNEKKLTEEEVIGILNKIVSELNAEADESGACVYNAGGKTHCAPLSKSNCDALGGAWTKGGKCP